MLLTENQAIHPQLKDGTVSISLYLLGFAKINDDTIYLILDVTYMCIYTYTYTYTYTLYIYMYKWGYCIYDWEG